METTDSALAPSRPSHPLFRASTHWILFVLWCLAVTILSSIPGDRFGPAPFSFADKTVHFLLFAAGGLFFAGALRRSTGWRWRMVFLVSLAALAGFGFLDELHQVLTPGRSGGDLGDMTADALGAAFGIGLGRLLHGRHHPKADRGTPRPDRTS